MTNGGRADERVVLGVEQENERSKLRKVKETEGLINDLK